MSEIPLYDRDLSWLSFNYRVLLEAQSESVPLLERLRFLAIYSSNLDEFFRVRVASVRRLADVKRKKIEKHLDFDPVETLNSIHNQVESQLDEYGATLRSLIDELKEEGVYIHMGSKEDDHLPELRRYFKTHVLAYLQPQAISKEKLFIKNKALYLALCLESDSGTEHQMLNTPSDKLPRFYKVKDGATTHFYFLDDVIRWNLDLVFPGKQVIECRSFKLNKDADLQIDDEFSGNLVEKIEKQVKKRDLGVPTRFLFDSDMTKNLLGVFKDQCGIQDADLSHGGRYHNLNDFFQVDAVGHTNLEYERLSPVRNRKIDANETLFESIESADQILHFPYQSYEYVLQFFNEAAIHPEVKEINATFYRMAKNSRIGEALISAAKNGKSVQVFMEVKARFDEENNLLWADRMKKAGVNIRYSMPGLKVHAKVALVRRETEGRDLFYGFFGTGNLNESTAKIYCDHGLLTCNPEMTRELNSVFTYLINGEKPAPFEHLIVSQFGATDRFKELINREVEVAKEGGEAHIIVKVNNLEEPRLIKKLYQAAKAGVKVEVIARSICCMVPGTHGIEVSRIVDRYLEHARIFYFKNQGNPKVFLGSSDWMKRNLRRRIEVTFPVYDAEIKNQLIRILELQLRDNTKRVLLDEEIQNVFPTREQEQRFNAQLDTYSFIKEEN